MATDGGWYWYEKRGNPVYASKEDLKKHKALTREAATVGMNVLALTFFGYAYAKLRENEFGVYFLDNESYYWPLDYDDEDDCFIVSAVINKEAIKTIEVSNG